MSLEAPTQWLPIGSSIIKAKSWCYIDVANPTLNRGLNANSSSISSDTNGSYDGASVGTKMLVNFEKQITLKSVSAALTHLFNFGGGSAGVSITISGSGVSFAVTGTLRLSLITAAFVTANQNWNNRGSLMLGTQFTEELDHVSWSGGSMTIGSGGIPFSTQNTMPGAIEVTSNAALSFYGFMVEAKPTTGVTGFTLVATQAAQTPSLADIKAPYIVPASLY